MANIQGKKAERIICRLYIRHRCTRGDLCPFYHPGHKLNPESPTMTWLNLCKNYKMGRCLQQDCRYFHVTQEEEDSYRQGRDIAPSLLEQAMRKALLFEVALTGTRATCKSFLQDGCNLPTCPYRHISRHEFADEVLNTLRNEFEIILGPSGTDIPGSQQFSVPQASAMNKHQLLNTPVLPVMGQGLIPAGMNNKNDNDAYIQKLEKENDDIYQALDPDQKASSLEEIRERLLTLHAALHWKEDDAFPSQAKGGFIDDGLPPGMAVVDYGHGEPSFEQTNIDSMRRRDAKPVEPMMFGRMDEVQRSTRFDNYDNPPMDIEEDNSPDEESECKLFIGGLEGGTETKALRNYFSKFGELVDSVVVRDKNGKSRGFGFVTFRKAYMAEAVERAGPHRIDRKVVDTKFAKPRPGDEKGPKQHPSNDRGGPIPKRSERSSDTDRGGNNIPKLFVGGLNENVTTEVLESYFQRYGRIIDAISMQDPKTRRPRGFGFVEFASIESLEDSLADAPHIILGCPVTVDKSVPRESDKPKSSGGGGVGGGGGGGGSSSATAGSGISQRESVSTESSEPCKMFVGGLNPRTREKELKDYFSRFGQIMHATVQKDARKASKGYGFVVFRDPSIVDDVINSGPHEVDSSRVDVGYATKKKEGREVERDNRRPEPKFEKPPRNTDDDCKLYVGNLTSDITEVDLHECFMGYGDIKTIEIKQGPKNKKVFGFVIFRDPSMVDAALADAPHEINGCLVETNYATKKGEKDIRKESNIRRPGKRDRDGEMGSEPYQPCKLFVGNLNHDSTEESLYDYFYKYGEITETKVNTDADGISKGFGFVTFAEEMSAREALEDGPHEIDGQEVNLGTALGRNQNRREGFKKRYDRDGSEESASLSSKRKAEKRSHLD